MIKKYKAALTIYFILLLIFLLITGCSHGNTQQIKATNNTSEIDNKGEEISIDHLKEGITIKEIDISKLKDKELNKVIKDEALKNGVYGYFYKDKGIDYIFFNGIEHDYNNISFNINKKLLTISYKEKPIKGFNGKSLFKIEKNPKEAFDTIRLLKDGKDDSFRNIYAN